MKDAHPFQTVVMVLMVACVIVAGIATYKNSKNINLLKKSKQSGAIKKNDNFYPKFGTANSMLYWDAPNCTLVVPLVEEVLTIYGEEIIKRDPK